MINKPCTNYQNLEGFPGHCDSCHDDYEMGYGGMCGENEDQCCKSYDWIAEYEESYIDPSEQDEEIRAGSSAWHRKAEEEL